MSNDSCHYWSGEEVRLGDHVQLGTKSTSSILGKVVFVIDRNEFASDFPRRDWLYLKKGFMVQFNDGNLIHYEQPEEDLKLLSRL